MKSLVYELTAPRTLVAREIELDENHLGVSEVLAATEFSAISPGTELASWQGKPPLRPSVQYPRFIGYCNVARVLKVGLEVADIQPGDHILTHQSHRSHFVCQRTEILLSARGLDVEARRRLSSVYLYHLGYMALLGGGYVPGHEVAVVGLGALGLTTASLARAFGCRPFIFTRRSLDEIPYALRDERVFSKTLRHEEWQSGLSMGGVDLSINTSDAWSDYLLCLQAVRKGGIVVLLGFPGRGVGQPEFNPLDSEYLYDRQLTVRHVGHVARGDLAPIDVRFTLQRNIEYLFSLMQRGAIDPSPLTAWNVRADALPEVYEKMASRKSTEFSAVLNWVV